MVFHAAKILNAMDEGWVGGTEGPRAHSSNEVCPVSRLGSKNN